MQISPINTEYKHKKGLNITAPESRITIGQYNSSYNPTFGTLATEAVKESKGIIHYLAKGIGKIADSNPMKKLVDYLEPKDYQKHVAAFVGSVLSVFYMFDTAKSKKIEKEQKLPLILNQGAVAALSTIGGYKLDGYLDKKLTGFTDNFHISSMSNPEYQGILLQLKKDKENLELLTEAAEKIKSPNQMINKKLLDNIDDPKKFNEIKNDASLLKKDYAKKLIEKINSSENPRKILEENYNKTDDFMKLLKEDFRFLPNMRKNLEKLITKGEADETAKTFFEELKSISKEEKDKIGKASEMFLEKMPKSKTLQKMFSKNSFNSIFNIISEYDKKLAVNKTGYRFGKSIMIFAMIYRFVSPVIATPIANAISSKIEDNKKAKKAGLKQSSTIAKA